jgi:cobalt-precorrin 5A hydrolase / cobalt-factor III methyltransferase / precorrin-3B C17-methyltransferase
MTPALPEGAAVVVLGPSALPLARRICAVLPRARLHAPRARVDDADVTFDAAAPHLAALFAAGTPIIGLCASGILIRAVAPLLADKTREPPVVAVAEDGSTVVPLLGGHHGANAVARAIADVFGVPAAITTAGDLRLGVALDAPPPGWRVANPERAKAVAAALLAGEPVTLSVEAGNAEWLRPLTSPVSTAAEKPYVTPLQSRMGVLRQAQDEVLSSWPLFDAGLNLPHPELVEGRTAAIQPNGMTRVARREADATIRITDAAVDEGETALVFHPPVLTLGVGCARGCSMEELAELVDASLAAHHLSPGAVAAVVSLELKMDEPAIHDLAARLGVPARFFGAAELLAETPRLATPSDAVFRETGCYGVAEGAALAAVGRAGVLVAPKRKSAHATCAVARATVPLDLAGIGMGRGSLAIIGIGPGDPAWRTAEADRALAAASDVVGYGLYLDLLGAAIAGKARHESGLGAETARARKALALAAEGRPVALVSSGDAGIYGLAALVFELLDRDEMAPSWRRRVEVRVVPGVSALQAAAARLGAPLGHDFCAISLSDLLTPWPLIEQRLRAAAEADFVMALYNPASERRRSQIVAAREILLAHRAAETPVALARNLGRASESLVVTTLGALDVAAIDMLTLALVGNRATRVLAGDPPLLYTPRGYAAKRERAP